MAIMATMAAMATMAVGNDGMEVTNRGGGVCVGVWRWLTKKGGGM